MPDKQLTDLERLALIGQSLAIPARINWLINTEEGRDFSKALQERYADLLPSQTEPAEPQS